MHAHAVMWTLLASAGQLLGAPEALPPLDPERPPLGGTGWGGFTDVGFLVRAVLALVLASVLGSAIAFHPRARRKVDRLEEAEAQKAYVLYSAIGAIAGMMVLRYGVLVGFVIFGIGGLIRFRTDLRSAPMTGRLIFVTLVGLCCGLDLPHLAVLATAFGFALIAVLDARTTYRIAVKGLAAGAVADAAHAYRALLEREGCRILGERKSFAKEQVTLVFRAPHRVERDRLERRLETEIPDGLRGAVDWEAE
jgi:hypothetical protein